MEMDDRLYLGPAFIKGPVKRQLLGWRVAGDVLPVRIELGQLVRLKETQARIGRRRQKAIGASNRDVPRRARGVVTSEKRSPPKRNPLSQFAFHHDASKTRSAFA